MAKKTDNDESLELFTTVEPVASADEQETNDLGGDSTSVNSAIKSKGGIPRVLSEEGPVEDSGELTLARYAAQAYLEYALSVVKSRALPDVFDGMKPVQRRILYVMDRMRLAPPAKAVKSARVVGDVLGKYHPHGDQAAYEAMVRMAQDFSLRYPLIDGEGNFGSRDGDGPAAMRYTEARLTKISELLLSELDSDDVEFVPNYDGSFKEPTQLPARMPFVLLNGASGIAVGMATEIPPHNLTEVGQAILLLLKKPQATLDEVLALMPAPDFPGGGQIITPASEIRSIYASGRGSLRVRARYHFEELQRGQWQLVVDELPPAANAELVLSQIEEITNPKPKSGKKALSADQISAKTSMLSVLDGVRNECDKDTKMRLVFEPKSSKIDRDLFVNLLLTQTSLECNAPMNLVMLGIDGHPRQKGLLEILNEWVQARLKTVERRSRVRLDKVKLRLLILDGRLIAIDNIDRVIEIVRFEEEPKATLMAEFDLTSEQADDILELRLRQLANLEIQKVQQEQAKLQAERDELERILGSESVLRQVVSREVKEAIKLYGDERRTLVEESQRATLEAPTVVEPVTVVISQKGFVRCRTGHGHDCSLMNFKTGDSLAYSLECQSVDTLIALANNGRAYSVAVNTLPSGRGDGLPLTSFIDLEAGSEIVGYVAGAPEVSVLLANTDGFGLVCTIKNLTARVRAGKAFMQVAKSAILLPPIALKDEEQLIACLSGEGRVLVFARSELRQLAGGGKGVTLMDLNVGEALREVTALANMGLMVQQLSGSRLRSATFVRGDFMRLITHRARKGKHLDVRFAVEHIQAAEINAPIPKLKDPEQLI